MKRSLSCFTGLMAVFFHSVCFPVPAAANDTASWSLSPSLGVHWGLVNEIVYDTSGIENQNDYLSLLSWEMRPVVAVGLDASRENGLGNRMSFSLRSAIPGLPSGEMNDYDWLYTDRDWSHWSVSDIWLRWGITFDAGYQFRVKQTRRLNMRIGSAYHLDWWAWRDRTRDSRYSTLNAPQSYYPGPFPIGDGFRDVPNAVPVGVNGIDYSVAYHSILAVVSVEWEGQVMFVNFTGRIGPVLAFSHDHHKLRTDFGPYGVHFYDHGFGGPWLDLLLEAGFQTAGSFAFSLRGEFAWLAETRGNSIYVFTDGSPKQLSKDSAGFSFHRIGVSAYFIWQLGARP